MFLPERIISSWLHDREQGAMRQETLGTLVAEIYRYCMVLVV